MLVSERFDYFPRSVNEIWDTSWSAMTARCKSNPAYHEWIDTPYDTEARCRRHVDDYRVLGLQVVCAGIKHVEITMGIKNLLDREPRFVVNSGGNQNGYSVEYVIREDDVFMPRAQ